MHCSRILCKNQWIQRRSTQRMLMECSALYFSLSIFFIHYAYIQIEHTQMHMDFVIRLLFHCLHTTKFPCMYRCACQCILILHTETIFRSFVRSLTLSLVKRPTSNRWQVLVYFIHVYVLVQSLFLSIPPHSCKTELIHKNVYDESSPCSHSMEYFTLSSLTSECRQ